MTLSHNTQGGGVNIKILKPQGELLIAQWRTSILIIGGPLIPHGTLSEEIWYSIFSKKINLKKP